MTLSNPLRAEKSLYDHDFYEWLKTTAYFLKQRRFDAIDLENLIEEIEAMGRSEKREIKNRLITLVEHLLKLIYWQSALEYNARGWRNTVIEQREQLILILEDSPSLRQELEDFLAQGYQKAVKRIVQKYHLSAEIFPAQSPFSLAEILNPDYLPQPQS